jgi:phosphoribosylanthranilate isomerase
LVKVKICGITNLEDALACVFYGADAIGFVFYKRSPRYINFDKAKRIAAILPKKILKVGVFFNAPAAHVKQAVSCCKLDMLQFHGDETDEFCRLFQKQKVIKALRVKTAINKEEMHRYKVYALLFDTLDKTLPGGTGRKFNWKIFRQAGRIKHPFFLSGGLTSANVARAIRSVKPDWVDVSTSLESAPGKKDHSRIKKFIKAARSA